MPPPTASPAERVTKIVQYYDPTKMPMVQEMLKKFSGNEERLIGTLVSRYGPEPTPENPTPPRKTVQAPPGKAPVQPAKQPAANAAPKSAANQATPSKAPPESAAKHPPTASVAPSKTAPVTPATAAHPPGSTPANKTPQAATSAAPSAVAVPVAHSPSSVSSPTAVSAAPGGKVIPSPSTLNSPLHEELKKFLSVYAPERVNVAAELLARSAGKEAEFIAALEQKYHAPMFFKRPLQLAPVASPHPATAVPANVAPVAASSPPPDPLRSREALLVLLAPFLFGPTEVTPAALAHKYRDPTSDEELRQAVDTFSASQRENIKTQQEKIKAQQEEIRVLQERLAASERDCSNIKEQHRQLEAAVKSIATAPTATAEGVQGAAVAATAVAPTAAAAGGPLADAIKQFADREFALKQQVSMLEHQLTLLAQPSDEVKNITALVKLCTKYAPEQIPDIRRSLDAYAGKERELFAALHQKYNVTEKDYADQPVDVRTITALRKAARARDLARFYGLGDHYVDFLLQTNSPTEDEVVMDVLCTLFPEAVANALVDKSQLQMFAARRLSAFMAFHNPTKVCEVPTILARYAQSPLNVMGDVVIRYYKDVIQKCRIPTMPSKVLVDSPDPPALKQVRDAMQLWSNEFGFSCRSRSAGLYSAASSAAGGGGGAASPKPETRDAALSTEGVAPPPSDNSTMTFVVPTNEAGMLTDVVQDHKPPSAVSVCTELMGPKSFIQMWNERKMAIYGRGGVGGSRSNPLKVLEGALAQPSDANDNLFDESSEDCLRCAAYRTQLEHVSAKLHALRTQQQLRERAAAQESSPKELGEDSCSRCRELASQVETLTRRLHEVRMRSGRTTADYSPQARFLFNIPAAGDALAAPNETQPMDIL